MQNCNLASTLQFLRLDTHSTCVKSDCNRFAVVTVVNLIKNWDVKSDVNAYDNCKQ